MSERQPLRIGCAGWNIPRISAEKFASEGSHLLRYSRTFNCAEINSSFYRPHKPSTWERWRDSVPEDFLFSVKAPRAITHDAKLEVEDGVLLLFLRQAAGLGGKLGPILFQLPPSLHFESKTARGFLTLLRRHFSGDVVWEPRHSSWFTEEASALLKEFGIARVGADPACVSTAAEPGGAAGLVYFRLHGSPRRYYSSYDDRFLSGLAARLAAYAATAKTWCIFDNTASGAAIQNALELSRKL